MKQGLIITAALVALVFAAHLPALRAGFVWDDTALILRDPLIRSPQLAAEGFQHFLFTDATASNFYRPLQRLTYTAEYIAFGFHARPYHFDSIFLHALTVAALFLLALAFLELYGVARSKAFVIAWIAAAAWAIHPLHSGVVDYVSGRADSLAALFGFAALCFTIQALRQTEDDRPGYLGRQASEPAAHIRRSRKTAGRVRRDAGLPFHALAALALLASALSKESGLIFGAIYLALIALQKRWRMMTPAFLALACVATTYLTLRNQAGVSDVPTLSPPVPAIVRPIIAARALAEYAGLIIAPLNSHVERDVESHPWGTSEASVRAAAWRELETAAGIVVAAAFLFWFLRARRDEPAIFVLLVFAGIAYLPICGLFALNATMAEHWVYVASAFLMLAITLQVSSWLKSHRARSAGVAIAAVWIALLGARSFYRAQDWKDDRTFFQNTIANGGDSARMLINLGSLEMNAGNLPKAEELLQVALKKEPEQPFAILNLAAVALKRNDFAAAREFLMRAAKHPVTEAQAYEMMAVLEFKETGKINLLRLRQASRIGAPSWSIEKRYVRALDEMGRTDAAVAELRAVLATEWYRAETWKLLSEYRMKIGQTSDATMAIAEAHRLDVHLSDR